MAGMFVIVWDKEGGIEHVVRWDVWLAIPPMERPFNTTMLNAQDELDAFVRAQRGERWDNW
jgi:hypothetical protein